MAAKACGLRPLLRALRADARGREGVPFAETPRCAVPAVPRRRLPGAVRAADLREVGLEAALLDVGRAPGEEEGKHGSVPYFPLGHGGWVKSPPSTQMVCPVMYALSSLARKRTVRATSAGVPTRPRGVTPPHVPA